MSANKFGNILTWTSFGESHGTAMGVVIDGCPAGVEFRQDWLVESLQRRRPGKVVNGKNLTSSRDESDVAEILSGIFEGKTLGTPIAVVIRNKDQRSQDYSEIKSSARIGHADDVWQEKFGHWDHRGGGRASARETVSRAIVGAFAEMICSQVAPEISIFGFVDQLGPLKLESSEARDICRDDMKAFPLNFPSTSKTKALEKLLEEAKVQGESYGGCVQIRLQGLPRGLGQPVFHKLKNDLASAFMSIGASVGVEFGKGFSLSEMPGSEVHKTMESSVYGGLRGGISTGETVTFRIAFKPTSSIGSVSKKGRHDPSIVPRAVPVVEAMAWAVVADHLLWSRLDQI